MPCSGKTTIINELLETVDAVSLDGDAIRKTMNRDLGFSRKDREENLRRAAVLAQLLNSHGINVLAGFVSPYEDLRMKVKAIIEEGGSCYVVYVRCSVDECIRRDVKGMYRKARLGLIQGFTGVSDPYEEPVDPDVIVETETETLRESVDKILCFLAKQGLIRSRPATLFIGDYSPLRTSDKAAFDKALKNHGRIVVAIKETSPSGEPYTLRQRRTMIETAYTGNPNVRVLVFPEVEKICIRDRTGYNVIEVETIRSADAKVGEARERKVSKIDS